MPASSGLDHAPIGILCAMPEERSLLLEALEHPADAGDPILTVSTGTLDGQAVVLAEAGVGKVQAATSATRLLDRFRCRALMLSGVAGGVSPNLGVGDLVVANRVIDVDYGRATDHGRILYQPGSIPLPHLEAAPGYQLPPDLERRIRERLDATAADAALGTIVTTDAFLASTRIRDELAASWSALAIEMEGAAVCGVAERYGVPWLVVRALSDRAGEDSDIDYGAFMTTAAASAANLLRTLLPVFATDA